MSYLPTYTIFPSIYKISLKNAVIFCNLRLEFGGVKFLRVLNIFFVLFSLNLSAKHIVGGEIIYDYLGNNQYRITLKQYRDCTTEVPFDGQANGATAIITVLESNGALVDTFNIGSPIVTSIPGTINNSCIQPPTGVCVEEGLYTYTLTLPPLAGGYYVVYQRCCRNNTILNLVNPGNTGSTYYTKIPGPEEAAINSSPRFKIFPPIYICNNLPFTFDHSATDPDGDQLVYSLYTPFQGLDASCPSLGTNGCPTSAAAPPYTVVAYTGSYSPTYPISASPAFTIDPNTGVLTGQPNLIGQFVVSICAREYRNGVLINIHYRDFQFNVRPCIVTVASVFKEQEKKCDGFTVNFVNQSFGTTSLDYFWDFGVTNLSNDTSNVLNPSYTYADTGRYEVTLIVNRGKPCCDTMKRFFYIYPELKVSFDKQNAQCLKNNNFNFVNTSQGLGLTQYNWDFSASANPATSASKNPTGIVYTQAGKFFVKLRGKQFSCIDSCIDTVRVYGRPTAKINNLPLSLCDPARVAFSNGSASDLPVTYKWLFSDGGFSSDFEPVHVFTPPGIYGATLQAITNYLCPDTSFSSVKNITVNPSPVADFTFTPHETTIFDPDIKFYNTGSEDIVQWRYEYGDGASDNTAYTVHTYSVKGNYNVLQVATNGYGCIDTAEYLVKILPEYRFWIPNCFTPNEDKLNDVFKPIGIGWLNYEFYIYNKWGQLIFKTTDPDKGWDGRFAGKRCEQDVYVWKVRLLNEVGMQQEEHYGKVTLLPSEE